MNKYAPISVYIKFSSRAFVNLDCGCPKKFAFPFCVLISRKCMNNNNIYIDFSKL